MKKLRRAVPVPEYNSQAPSSVAPGAVCRDSAVVGVVAGGRTRERGRGRGRVVVVAAAVVVVGTGSSGSS